MSGAALVVTLCGSTRFSNEFRVEAERLTLGGHVVLMPHVFSNHDPVEDSAMEPLSAVVLHNLEVLHFQKIRMADEVYVIDPGGYVGESTAREIAYAKSLGKPIRYLSDEPWAWVAPTLLAAAARWDERPEWTKPAVNREGFAARSDMGAWAGPGCNTEGEELWD